MTVDISIIISALAGIVAVLGFFRNGKKDVAESATSLARIEVKLDTLTQRLDETCKELVQHREELNKHTERLATIEASLKQAHRRLDAFEARVIAAEERSQK